MAESYQKLDDYQHARLRTEMYLGSREEHRQTVVHFNGTELEAREFTWTPALFTAIRELIDNSLDEMIGHGHGDTLRVDYDPEKMLFTVEDNGRGLPIEEKTSLGKGPAASILLGEARAGRNFDQRGQVAGVNGLGAAVVNFTSEWFQLDVWRDGKHLRQRWSEGTYRKKDIHKTDGPTIKAGSKTRRGTRIQFVPSAKVYPHRTLPEDFLKGRLWDIAVTNPDLKVYYNGERLLLNRNTRDPIKGTLFGDRKVGIIDIQNGSFRSRFYVCPNFVEGEETIHSVVNNLPVFQGGSHVEAFRDTFYPLIMAGLEKQLKKDKIKPVRGDVTSGLLIWNVTTMDDPRFDSQTKGRLINEVRKLIKEGFIESDARSFLRRNDEWVQEVLARIRDRAQSKAHKEVQSAQKAMKKQKVAGLKDATGRDRSKCVLFLAEGESAISGITNVRDPSIHGGIGLRGKVMNVNGEAPKKVLASQVLADIMTATGLQIGVKAMPSALRYGSIYIATDEDEDGKNITALLVNFFYTFWPELFEDPNRPYVYKFSTPFIIAVKGKERRYAHAHNYEQFKADMAAGKYKGWKIIRAKGLARLSEADWKLALAEPVLVPVIDDGNLKETLDLIFNSSRADDRKEWLKEE